jgi:hypothetical protein
MQIAKTESDRTTVAGLEGQLVLLRPIKVDERDTRHGRRMCCDTEAWKVDKNAQPEPLGIVTVWNEVLLREVAANIGVLLAGRIERPGRAFIFADLTADEIALAERAERSLKAPASSPVPADDSF